jgi:hypothetical protein
VCISLTSKSSYFTFFTSASIVTGGGARRFGATKAIATSNNGWRLSPRSFSHLQLCVRISQTDVEIEAIEKRACGIDP